MTTSAVLNMHRDIESEITLEAAREIPIADRNQEELAATIIHESDIATRRLALRLFKLDILQDAEVRTLNALNEARK